MFVNTVLDMLLDAGTVEQGGLGIFPQKIWIQLDENAWILVHFRRSLAGHGEYNFLI